MEQAPNLPTVQLDWTRQTIIAGMRRIRTEATAFENRRLSFLRRNSSTFVDRVSSRHKHGRCLTAVAYQSTRLPWPLTHLSIRMTDMAGYMTELTDPQTLSAGSQAHIGWLLLNGQPCLVSNAQGPSFPAQAVPARHRCTNWCGRKFRHTRKRPLRGARPVTM